jgi:hypothetical protein
LLFWPVSFDFILEPITSEAQRRELYLDILEHLHEGEPQPVGLQHEDLAGTLGSVLVAVLAVLPSLSPFYFCKQYRPGYPNIQHYFVYRFV